MKTLTVKQPWAWGLIFGPKRIENRSQPTRHRGPLAILAGKGRAILTRDEYLALVGERRPELVRGAVIGVVDLIDCLPLAVVAGEPFASGPWCWVTTRPRPLSAPLPWRGTLAFQEIPDDLILPRLARDTDASMRL